MTATNGNRWCSSKLRLATYIFIYMYTHVCTYMLSCIYAIGSLVRLSALPWLARRFPVKGNRSSICAVRFQQQTGSAKPPCVRTNAVEWISGHARRSADKNSQMRIFKDRELSAGGRDEPGRIWGEVEAESKSGLELTLPLRHCAHGVQLHSVTKLHPIYFSARE